MKFNAFKGRIEGFLLIGVLSAILMGMGQLSFYQDYLLRDFRGVMSSTQRPPKKRELRRLQYMAHQFQHTVKPVRINKKTMLLFVSKEPGDNILTPSLCTDIVQIFKNQKIKCVPNWEMIASQNEDAKSHSTTQPKPESRSGKEEKADLKVSAVTLNNSKNWYQEIVGSDLTNRLLLNLNRGDSQIQKEFGVISINQTRVKVFGFCLKRGGVSEFVRIGVARHQPNKKELTHESLNNKRYHFIARISPKRGETLSRMF